MPVRKRAVKKTTAKKTATRAKKATVADDEGGVSVRDQAWADYVKEQTGKSLDAAFLKDLRKLYTQYRAEERANRSERPAKKAAAPAKKTTGKKTAKRATKRAAKKTTRARKAASEAEPAPVSDINTARAKKTSAKPRKTAKSAAAPF